MVPPLSILTQILRIVVENIVIFIVTTMFVFALIRSIPGDPTMNLGVGADPNEIAAMREQLGLEDAFLVQYARRLHATLTLNLGVSGGLPNADKVLHGTRVTLGLTLGAALLLLLVSVPIGVLSGMHPRSGFWNATNFLIYMLSMVPIFLLAYGSFFFFGFPPVLYDAEELVLRGRTPLTELQLKTLIYMTMIGVLAIGDGTITELIRAVREETGRILESDFIRAVRANGGAVWKHMAKNLFVPVATMLNLRILYLLGGAVVVESVYEYPGLGSLTVEAVGQREYDLVFSITVVSVLLVLLVTTTNRILITLVDPRARD